MIFECIKWHKTIMNITVESMTFLNCDENFVLIVWSIKRNQLKAYMTMINFTRLKTIKKSFKFLSIKVLNFSNAFYLINCLIFVYNNFIIQFHAWLFTNQRFRFVSSTSSNVSIIENLMKTKLRTFDYACRIWWSFRITMNEKRKIIKL